MKAKMKALRQAIDANIDEYLQKTTKVILSATKSYPNDWDKTYDKIEELFYEFLTKVYKNVNIHLKSIYCNLPELDIKNIFDLTYDIDGKHITERLKEYWGEAEKNLASNPDNLISV